MPSGPRAAAGCAGNSMSAAASAAIAVPCTSRRDRRMAWIALATFINIVGTTSALLACVTEE
jgi:hypothetical protein